MNTDLLYLIFVIVLLLAMLAYMGIKDKENAAKMAKLEGAIEDLSKELHYLKKGGISTDEGQNEGEEELENELLKDELKIMLENELGAKITPILRSIKIMENIIDEFQSEQQNRLSNLEAKTQSMSKITPNYDTQEQKIEALFKEGKSVEQIAKDLRIGTGNVELVLKFKQLIK